MQETAGYDIIIIGAGIQGAGVAQAAAACGYNTLVIEKFPEAGMGTSSKSSKLIHGGLRYLETGQFKLVNECLRERKTLLKNAPSLVKLLPFYIPVYSHSSRPAWLIFLGLVIYSIFSFKPFRIISRKKWDSLGGLNLKNLKCVFQYYDAQTDDKLLTHAVINSASSMGAEISYNTDFISSNYQNKKHHVTYKKDNKTYTSECQFLINCSGPWTTRVQKKIHPTLNLPPIDLIAGTHIVIKEKPNNSAYYLEAHDNRAVFILPWKKKYTLIGTTERHFKDSPDSITHTEEEVTYLLDTYKQYFNRETDQKQVKEIFTGLRVLPGSAKSVFKKSRDSMIISSPEAPGLITLVGGKLTAYRASSEEIISLINKTLTIKSPTNQCDTSKIRLD